MLFPPHKVFHPAFIAAVAIIAALSCSKSKEQTIAADPLMPLISTTAELDTALTRAGNRILVIDFYADWCRPCGFLSPTMHELAAEHRGNASFYRVNVDRSADLARAFGASAIPYVVFMKNGRMVYALPGVNPKEIYTKILSIGEGPGSADECIRQLNEKM